VDVAPSLPVVISVKECVLRRKSRCTNWGFTLRGTRSGWGKDKWIYNCYVEGVSKNGPAESAALREGDQMVCINGLAVCDMEHSVVVEHFQSCDNVKLLYIPSKYLEKH
jgi:C-terminal processing protease CtpA/Prc